MTRRPNPLQWPEGFARTPAAERTRSRFVGGLVTARTELLRELDRLGAANVVITSDLPVRQDGLPYADGRATDPAVAVWFVLADRRGNHQERVFSERVVLLATDMASAYEASAIVVKHASASPTIDSLHACAAELVAWAERGN